MSLEDDENYLWRPGPMVRVRIPEGNVKCPDCEGSGKVRIAYDSRNDYDSCMTCYGKGYLEEKMLEEMKKQGWFLRRDRP